MAVLALKRFFTVKYTSQCLALTKKTFRICPPHKALCAPAHLLLVGPDAALLPPRRGPHVEVEAGELLDSQQEDQHDCLPVQVHVCLLTRWERLREGLCWGRGWVEGGCGYSER